MRDYNLEGNCYYVSEALYHILGGKKAGWTPMFMRVDRTPHWFLKHKDTGMILDASRRQFGTLKIDYSKARGKGFLTKGPSKFGKMMMKRMTWFLEDTGRGKKANGSKTTNG